MLTPHQSSPVTPRSLHNPWCPRGVPGLLVPSTQPRAAQCVDQSSLERRSHSVSVRPSRRCEGKGDVLDWAASKAEYQGGTSRVRAVRHLLDYY